MSDFDVVVVSRDDDASLARCLQALESQGRTVGEIVAVDRSRKALLAGGSPGVPVLYRRGSPGSARNAGARQTRAAHIAFLGGEVEVQPGWAAAIAEALDDDAAVVAGALSRSRSVGGRSAEVGDPLGRNGYLPWGSALNLGVARAAFEDLGGFEEGLPALDDADFCFRAQLRGHRFVVAPGALAMAPRVGGRHASADESQAARAETLLSWRYRANPFFAAVPPAPGRRRVAPLLGRGLGWVQLLGGQRPVPDLVPEHETHRHVVMPLSHGPLAIVKIDSRTDVRDLVVSIRDIHDLAACPPGPEAVALVQWEERASWALALTRAAHAAGWDFDPELAAKRLEQEHPKTEGAAFVQMAAVLAWYQGLRGFVLLAPGEIAGNLAARLPGVPVVDLEAGGSLRQVLHLRGVAAQPDAPAIVLGPHVDSTGRTAALAARPAAGGGVETAADVAGTAADIAGRLSEDPVLFVSGCPRSGTTLLRNMIAAHPDLAAPADEGYFVTRAFGQMKLAKRTEDIAWGWELIKADRHFQAWDLDIAAIETVIGQSPPASYGDLIRILFAAVAVKEGKPLSSDKCTSYSMHWEWMAEQFPTSRFVHLVRDPREVCMSLPLQYFHHGGMAGAAWWWLFHVGAAPKAAAALGDRWLEIRYEDLIADPATQLKAICRHAGVEFDEAMLKYSGASSQPGGVHRYAAGDAPQEKIRGWRNSLSHDDLVTIERLTGRMMTRFGYEPETTGVTLRAGAMTARWLLEETRSQWLLSGAPRPRMVPSLLGVRWRPEL